MLKHLSDILPQPTAHGIGQKRVLLSQAETDTNLTQIAVTTLQAGEAMLTIEGNTVTCHEGDFVQVKCGEKHRLEAMKETRVLTIGVQI